MSFSKNWEIAYSENLQMSRWPWDDLVSNFMRLYKNSLSPQLNILELGCGSGANIPFFESLHVNYFGIDGSKTAIQKIQTLYPKMAKQLVVGDFTEPTPFSEKFDLIFDRASLTHNHFEAAKKAVAYSQQKLKPKGHYIGIHWFSDKGSYCKQGKPSQIEENTRSDFKSGPFVGIDPVHFFSHEEILEIFENFNILKLEHISREAISEQDRPVHSMWNIVAQSKI